jgi:hypothetical protein
LPSSPGLGLDAGGVSKAVASAEGNLQHAAMLRQHLAGLPPEQRRALGIPRGLAALLASAWERVATDPAVIDGLGILCAAREALTLDEQGAVAEYRLHHDSIRGQIAGATPGRRGDRRPTRRVG